MSTDLAYAILGQLGRAKRADDSLALTGGDDPVFVTPWRIARAGSAALGAVGLAVSDLWRLRTGKPQAVGIDRHAAAASLRSNTYVLQNGKRPVSWDPLAGHYATRDGRTMFLHTNHPHHRAGALGSQAPRATPRKRWRRPSPNGTGSPSRRRSPPAAASADSRAAARNGTPIRTASPSQGCR